MIGMKKHDDDDDDDNNNNNNNHSYFHETLKPLNLQMVYIFSCRN